MAKQNVSFIERHVEKIVVGVCGAALLAICFLYLVNSPNHVTVGGESLGPSDFYKKFKDESEKSLAMYRSAKFTPAPDEPKHIEDIKLGLQPPDKSKQVKLPPQLQVAFVELNPYVPPISGPAAQNVDLAEVVAPDKPIGMSGLAVTKLPQAPIISGSSVQEPPAAAAQPSDTYWVSLASTINRKAQREKFEAAHYDSDRMWLRITGIEVERQLLLPGGDWGPAEKITPYGPVANPPKIVVVQEGDAEPSIDPQQVTELQAFLSKIGTYDQQAALFLRPEFQAILARGDEPVQKWWWEWTIPRKLKGYDGDIAKDLGVVYPDEVLPKQAKKPLPPKPQANAAPRAPAPAPQGEGRGGGGERGPGVNGGGGGPAVAPRPAAAPAGDPAATKEVMENFGKGQKAEAEQNYILANEMYEAALGVAGGPEAFKKKARDQLAKIKEDVEQAVKDKEERDARRLRQMELNFGPDMDPVWLTDITVAPGKSYRYRLRLLALNAYAGIPSYLKKPQDAGKVVIPGAWSEWSDPVTAKPDKQFFAYSMAGNNKSVQIEIHQWINGDWKPGTNPSISIGDPIVAKSGKLELSYDGTITSIDDNRPYRDRIVGKDNAVKYGDPTMTQAVVLVNARGEAEEHFVKADFDRRKAFNTQKTDESKTIKELSALNVSAEQFKGGAPPPGPAMGQGPVPGIPRGPDAGGRDAGPNPVGQGRNAG